MDLATIEVRKARAAEALARGGLDEASQLYELLAPEYERRGFVEGLLALQFNHLLVAIEAGDRRLVDRLMADLGARLSEAPPSPTTVEVATRVCALFVAPLPGIDHERSAALVALASDHARPVDAPRDDAPTADELPSPDVLGRIYPEDAAVLLTWLGRVTRGRPGLPDWLRAVQAVVGEGAGLEPEAAHALRAFSVHLREEDLFRAYPALVEAFEGATRTAPELAADLAVGLSELEDRGLPERLQYTPALPEEHRLRATAELHGRLGTALARATGAERLARAQMRRVVSATSAWLARVETRGLGGGARAEDVEREATVALWRARALRGLGRIDSARAALERSVARAHRQAFEAPYLAALVLREAAELEERTGHREVAAELYREAAEVALPGISTVTDDATRVELVDEVTAEGEGGRAALATDALVGHARCAEGDLEAARTLLCVARPLIDADLYARVTLVLELTAARAGDAHAAERALEAAGALGHADASALALLYRGLARLDDEKGRATALDDLARAAAEARRASAGAVRRTVEIAVALAHLDHATEADPARVEIHVRRAAEVMEPPAFSDGAGGLDFLLPADARLTANGLLRRVIELPHPQLARRLAAALRRRAGAPPHARLDTDTADAVRDEHRARFLARWLEGVVHEDEGAICRSLGRPRPASAWPDRRFGARAARLELHVLDDELLSFAVGPAGVRMRRVPMPRAELSERVAACMDPLRAGGPFDAAWVRASGDLLRILVTPWLDHLEQADALVIAADGPLADLAFGALWDGREFLAQRFDLARLQVAAPPLFEPEAPVAPRVARIVGDAATTRDLQLSTLAGDTLFDEVEVRDGEDLRAHGVRSALERARAVHLVGAVDDEGVALTDDEAPTTGAELAAACAAGGAVCATLMGPVEGVSGTRLVGELLGGLRGGVLARRWAADDDELLLDFLADAAGAIGPEGLLSALGAARRRAIHAQRSPAEWATYALYFAE